jgi:plastocyanin
MLVAATLCWRNAAATEWFVDVGGTGFSFAPSELLVTAGDTVTFVNRGGFHNVVADDGSFRCANGCDGDGGSGNPSDAPWTASVIFSGPGTFGYHCEVHGLPQLGMYGSITVAPRVEPPPASAPSTVPAAQWRWLLLLSALVVAAAWRVTRRRG